jgi:integrase
MATTLTAVVVRNARPAKARRDVADASCPGLQLTIEPSGTKRWTLRYRRPDGRSARLVLGSVYVADKEPATEPVIGAHMTLAGARRLVAALRHEIAQGRDPGAAHLATKHRHRVEADARAANTFSTAACDFIQQYASKKIRRWKEQARLLGFHPDGLTMIDGGLADRWSGKPVAEIDGHDIYLLIDETRQRGAPGLERRSDGPTEGRARAMHGCLSKMFKWLQQHRRIETNPCAGVHRPETPQSRDRVLSAPEIKKFWLATDAERVEFGALLKMLLFTGCRVNEVTGMRHSEISDDGTTWTIPGGRTKNHRTHVVPLPPLARQLIASVGSDGDLVFTTDDKSPVSVGSKIKHRLDKAMKISPWIIHDLRRTFVTGCAELGIRPDVIELTVNHISGVRGGIAGVYNRSELMPERRAALERWAIHVEGLVSGKAAKVVPIRA